MIRISSSIIEGFERHAASLKELLAEIDANEIVAVTCELTLAEVLVKPLKDQNEAGVAAYRKFLRPGAALQISQVTRQIFEAAATIRATNNVALADAIHLASCIHHGCSSFLTNDLSLRALSSVNVKLLDEVATSLS